MISITAPAKINLFLRICGKNNEGYHLLDSLVAFTEFGDHLTIEPAHEDKLVLTGNFASAINTPAKDNLVMRALNALRESGSGIGPLHIVLEKRIPVGAGLGGGSSDAAALLLAINENSEAPFSPDALYDIGLTLGADVPVCLARGCQRIANIGDVLTPHYLTKTGAVLLVNPGVSLSTKDVFTQYSSSNEKCGSGFGGPISMLNTAELVRLGNDLTKTAATLVPQISHCLDILLAAAGVIAAAMSGSGTSCFAFFDNRENAVVTEQFLRNEGYWVEVTSIFQSESKSNVVVFD